ncbi:MBL fold metallo-hydrolase [Halopelagius longus]|uniref:Glyoxylase, beta-lactamase superfamily II n=1 Tax=Halopelagius longus TaxID=1236180 RepID=A0A1H1BWT6_9EURY|nr:MBL fold metallo-hydrolase [Halopelagius longus]RDI70961.1 MBL fold metallo-hydrolase [Halopelagius longus]SDQ56417.1 Glyoxylase, beta-lactamase superfamily II [Halopelagius longus]
MSLEPGAVRRFELRGVNAYLVDDHGVLTLVDAGTPLDGDRMRAMLDRAGLSPGDIERVLLTHYDVDHVGALGSLGLDEETPIYVAEPDAAYLQGEVVPLLTNAKGVIQRLTAPFATVPENEVRLVADGDSVGEFDVYRTPGHTPGHVCYHHDAHEAAFLGDLVRESDGALELLPRFVNYDTDQNAESVREFAERVPPFEAACVGHGHPLPRDGYGALRRLADRLA